MLHHIILSRPLVIILTICIIANNLPIIESQSIQSCVAPPCAYKDECANKFGECGAGDAYCNVESLWRPFCGGGGNLERTALPTPQPTLRNNTPKPTTDNRPATNRPTMMNRQPTNRPQSDPTLPPQLSSILSPRPPPAPTPPKVTSNPTTSFEGWLNDKDPSNNNNGGGDVSSSSNVDYTQTTNNNQTGWFDKEGWDSSRGQEEEGSAFNFWGGNNNKNGGVSCLVNGRGGVHVTLLVVATTLYCAFGGV